MDSDIDYLQKYLKYKIKYLSYKNNLEGGFIVEIITTIITIILKINENPDKSSSTADYTDNITTLFTGNSDISFNELNNKYLILFSELIYCILCNYLQLNEVVSRFKNLLFSSLNEINKINKSNLYEFLVELIKHFQDIKCAPELLKILNNKKIKILTLEISYNASNFVRNFGEMAAESAASACELATDVTQDLVKTTDQLKMFLSSINPRHVPNRLKCLLGYKQLNGGGIRQILLKELNGKQLQENLEIIKEYIENTLVKLDDEALFIALEDDGEGEDEDKKKVYLILYSIIIIRILKKCFNSEESRFKIIYESLLGIEKLLIFIYIIYFQFKDTLKNIFENIIDKVNQRQDNTRNLRIILFEILYTLITGKARCVNLDANPKAYQLLIDEDD